MSGHFIAPESKIQNRQSRQGVILLFILGLLALFSLVTVTFVVVARIHKRGAQFAAQVERTGDSPQKLLTQAALQVARGTNNPRSVIGPHSLLEDLYGSDGFRAQVINAPAAPTVVTINSANSGLVDIAIDTNPSVTPPLNVPGNQLDTTNGYYAGRVLTFTSGLCAGTSARIVDYRLDTSGGSVAPPNKGSRGIFRVLWPKNILPQNGDRLVVNGAPFNGTGFGFNRDHVTNPFNPLTNVLLDRGIGAWGYTLPVALLPNAATLPRQPGDLGWDPNYFLINTYDPAGPGGADESYDAWDYQNMLLGARRAFMVTSIGAQVSLPLPSLHRPDLINYWYQQLDSALSSVITDGNQRQIAILRPDIAYNNGSGFISDAQLDLIRNLKRRFILRPLIDDHPNFTGSNPHAPQPNQTPVQSGMVFVDADANLDGTLDTNFHATLYSAANTSLLDVDNDGDGIPDSIWVDIGLPVQTTADGRTYKPLVAILCEDMDGKLNLNAHGQINHVVQNSTTITAGVQENRGSSTGPAPNLDTTGNSAQAQALLAGTGVGGANAMLPIGEGYGPAEVNLAALFVASPGDYRKLLLGDTGNNIPGRYGELHTATNYPPSPGETFGEQLTSASVNAATRIDLLSYLTHYFLPDDFHNDSGARLGSSYRSPPDLDGDGIVGLDPSGNPFYPRWRSNDLISGAQFVFGMGEALTSTTPLSGDKFNNPYQLDLFASPERRTARSGSVEIVDAPFQPTELERVLRLNDVDATSLPARLTLLSNVVANSRNIVTTESWDLPVPSLSPTADLVYWVTGGMPSPPYAYNPYTNTVRASYLHLSDLVRTRSQREALKFSSVAPVQVLDASFTLRDLGMELRRGLKFDLNRPLGNGRDEQQTGPPALVGYAVVDEPSEATAGETIWDGTFGAAVQFDHANNNTASGTVSTPSAADGLARQIYAKNLYVLMMLLLDEQFGDRAYSATDITQRIRLATQVAQWAVNVVDFRDADSIMTGFEFDALPFTDENNDGDPWDVDDNPSTDEVADTMTFPGSANVKRGLVWGVERPELLITETLAFHDRRTEDLDTDPSGKDTNAPMAPDEDFDQRVPPQGSLFIELYNPWSRDSALAGELYTNPGMPNAALNLQAYSTDTTTGTTYPVWRMMITRQDRAPDRLDVNDTWATTQIDRVVYFTNSDPKELGIPSSVVRHHSSELLPSGLRPGQYAVIGPDGVTDASFDPGDLANNRRLRLINDVTLPQNRFAGENGTGAFAPYTTQSDDPTSATATIRDVLAVPIDRVSINTTTEPRRLSVSEPATATGYPGPTDAMTGTYSPPEDVPLDMPNNRADLTDPADRAVLWSNSTKENFRHVHLQRLANPLLPWNPPYGQVGHVATRPVNPYLTIDTMPIDLTVYNSRNPSRSEEGTQDTQLQQNTAAGQPINFRSRQRAGGKNDNSVTPGIDLWSQATRLTGDAIYPGNGTLPADEAPPVSTKAPVHTLGYLNEAFLTAGGGMRIVQTDGYNIDPQSSGLRYNMTGMPKGLPFAAFHWPNRPFVSQYELLQVPAYSSAWLLAPHWGFETSTTTNHYTSNAQLNLPGLPAITPDKLWLGDTPFRHLMPWFVHTTLENDVVNPGRKLAPHIYRVLDYVHVPSRFTGCDEHLNPVQFQYGTQSLPNLGGAYPFEVVGGLHPPFNKVSRYREPGKININTIYDDGTTWQALTNNFPMAPTWPPTAAKAFWLNNVGASRMGYTGYPFGTPNPLSPTMMANPFRGAEGNFMVPLPTLRQRNLSGPIREGIESTLLRPDPAATPPTPLLVSTAAAMPANDPTRNSYFHYQLLTKLGNTITTRSNVYAVWITLGYFEVNRVAPRPNDPGFCPDGWQLGAELGADSGDIKRHRGFYLIDRSIPVGFQRGEDLNVLDCFLIQRFIE